MARNILRRKRPIVLRTKGFKMGRSSPPARSKRSWYADPSAYHDLYPETGPSCVPPSRQVYYERIGHGAQNLETTLTAFSWFPDNAYPAGARDLPPEDYKRGGSRPEAKAIADRPAGSAAQSGRALRRHKTGVAWACPSSHSSPRKANCTSMFSHNTSCSATRVMAWMSPSCDTTKPTVPGCWSQ